MEKLWKSVKNWKSYHHEFGVFLLGIHCIWMCTATRDVSLVCSAFSGRSRPPMTPVFSIMSSFLYMFIFHVVALHPVYHRISASHEFLSLPFCLLRLYAEWIHFSTHDLTNFSVFVGWCSSRLCFHPPCPKPLNWIGVQSNWFLLTSPNPHFLIPAFECPLSSTSTFLRHTIPYSKSESLLFFSLTLTSRLFSNLFLVIFVAF